MNFFVKDVEIMFKRIRHFIKNHIAVFSASMMGLVIGSAVVFLLTDSIFSNKYASLLKNNMPIDVAIVNLTKIKNDSLAFKSLNTVMSEESKKFQAQIVEIEKDIRQEYEKIKKLKKEAKISDENLRQMKEDLDRKSRDVEKRILKTKDDLDRRFSDASVVLEEKLKKIIEKIYEENGYDMVINATILDFPIVLNNREFLDITDEVIHALNIDLPKITLSS